MADTLSLKAKIEALVFAHGEPLSCSVIAEAVGGSREEVKTVLDEWKARLESDAESGVRLAVLNDAYQLVTKPEYGSLIEGFMKKDFSQNLSQAALETLTIVLYRGPLSRSEIDYIRGVNSSFMVRSLLLRGLIERSLDAKNRHLFVYEPSFALLRFLGIGSVNELPDYAELHQRYEEVLRNIAAEETQDNPHPDA